MFFIQVIFDSLPQPVLASRLSRSRRSRKQRGSWRRRERQAQHLQHTALSAQQKDQVLNEAKTLHPAAQPKLADMAPALMAHTNWKFVEQLLKVSHDTLTKPNRLLKR